MKPAPFVYHCPRSLDEALHLLNTLENARVLAGGQSLVPMLNLRVAKPDHLIDLGRITELVGIAETPSGLRIGAMTTQRTLEKSAAVKARCPLMWEALQHVGHQQTRNRGTLGGSLCHLDPAAELPLMACALDPTLTIASVAGRREISFSEFPVDFFTSQLSPNEMLIRVDFSSCDPRTGFAFEEFARRPADFAIVAVAAAVTVSERGAIDDARIAIAGLGPIGVRVSDAEN